MTIAKWISKNSWLGCAVLSFVVNVLLFASWDLSRYKSNWIKIGDTHGNFKPIFEAICGNLICNSCLHFLIYSEENKDFRLPSSPCSKATFEFWSTPKHAEPSLLHKVRYIIITKYHRVMFHEHEEILKWRIWPLIPHLDITHFDFKWGVRSLQHPKHMDANRSQPQLLQLGPQTRARFCSPLGDRKGLPGARDFFHDARPWCRSFARPWCSP